MEYIYITVDLLRLIYVKGMLFSVSFFYIILSLYVQVYIVMYTPVQLIAPFVNEIQLL